MYLASRRLKVGIGIEHAKLLFVDERMGVAVKHVMGEKAQREGASKLSVMLLQMAHAVAQAGELPRHARAMHHFGKLHAVAHMRRTHTEEKRIRSLVSQQERTTLLVRRDDSGGQAIDAFLTKKMMSDKCRHKGSPFMDAEEFPLPR